MTIFKQEIKSQKLALLIWSGAIGVFVAVIVFLYPNLAKESDKFTEMFSSMGSFSAAFGMDKLDIGTLPGFYSVESGNMLGIGGAFFLLLQRGQERFIRVHQRFIHFQQDVGDAAVSSGV